MTKWVKIIDCDYNNTGAYKTYYKEAKKFVDSEGEEYWHYSHEDTREYFFDEIEEPKKVEKTIYLHFD